MHITDKVAKAIQEGKKVSNSDFDEALGSMMTTKLTAFLANAFEVPQELRMLLVEKYDKVVERNTAMFFLCFSKYVYDTTGVLEDPNEKTFIKYSDKFDRFFASAVILTYTDMT